MGFGSNIPGGESLKAAFILFAGFLAACQGLRGGDFFDWAPHSSVPNELGLAGPFTGVHEGALIVAGGANFPKPVWETEKVWHRDIFALALSEEDPKWRQVGSLKTPLGYGTTVSVPDGIICIGGNDAKTLSAGVFLMTWNGEAVEIADLPKLPFPLCYSAAAKLGNHIYLVGGQTGSGLETASSCFLRLDWSKRDDGAENFEWEVMNDFSG